MGAPDGEGAMERCRTIAANRPEDTHDSSVEDDRFVEQRKCSLSSLVQK